VRRQIEQTRLLIEASRALPFSPSKVVIASRRAARLPQQTANMPAFAQRATFTLGFEEQPVGS